MKLPKTINKRKFKKKHFSLEKQPPKEYFTGFINAEKIPKSAIFKIYLIFQAIQKTQS
jgi:hypothetical protein